MSEETRNPEKPKESSVLAIPSRSHSGLIGHVASLLNETVRTKTERSRDFATQQAMSASEIERGDIKARLKGYTLQFEVINQQNHALNGKPMAT